MNDRRFYVVVASIAAGLLVLAALVGTWLDEEYTLATTAHGPIYAFSRSLSYELQAPLYFVVLALWRGIESSVFFARLFSVLCIVGFAFAAREIARRVRPGLSPLPFVVLAIINPFVVYAALEIRLYALALLLSALLWLAFHDGFLNGDRPRARVWFVVLAAASIYVQYFLAFTLVAGAFALIIAGRYAALRTFLLACGLVVIAIAPTFWWATAQTSAAYFGATTSSRIFGSIVQPAMQFALPRSYDWTGNWNFLKYAHHAVELVTVAFLFGFAAKRFDRREWALVSLPILMWCVFFLAACVLHLRYSLPRHFVGLYVPEIAALYVLISRVAVAGHLRLAVGIAALYALFASATLVTTYRAIAKSGDWPRVGAYLSTHVRSGERVAVFPARNMPALARYYQGPGTVQAFPHAENYDQFDEGSARLTSDSNAALSLSRLSRGHKVWLVFSENCADTESNLDGCGYLEEILTHKYPTAPEKAFFLNRVIELPGWQVPP